MLARGMLALALALAAGIAPGAARAAGLRILAFGDSLTAGYMLDGGDAFPAKLEAALRGAGYDARVANAGVSGDTTADGLARIDWALADPYDYAIVELGANDALRGLDPEAAYANLDAILARLAAHRIKVLLAGMLAPPNLGADYAKAFDAIFPRLAGKHGVPLYPFFLDGVALHPELQLADGLHPNARGVDTIVARILPAVEALLGPPAKP